MITTTMRIRNRGTELDPVYEAVEDGTNARMDGERRDLGRRSLTGWYPGIADYVRDTYGVTEDLTFPVSLDDEQDPTTFDLTFRGRTAEVTVHDLRGHRNLPSAWPSAEEIQGLPPEDMATVIRTILERGRYGWTRDEQSGPFRELLRKLIAAGRLEAVTEACELYFSLAPDARAGILQRMPAMLLNGYPRLLAVFRDPGSQARSWPSLEMADEIRRSVTTPSFRAVVDDVVERLRAKAA